MIQEFIKINFIFIIGILLLIYFITKHTKKSFILGIVTFIVASFIGYYTHYLSHNKYFIKCVKDIKLYDWFKNILLYHDKVHHDHSKKEVKYVVYEFLNNLLTQGGLLLIIIYIVKYLNTWIILIYAFSYATIHNINFQFLKPKTHQLHHKNKHCNFGYDLYDIIFNTKKGEIENTNHYLINFVLLTILFFGIRYLFIR